MLIDNSKSSAGRVMVRWNKTGEVMVIDEFAGTASAALAMHEQSAELGEYELDHDVSEDIVSGDYTVIR